MAELSPGAQAVMIAATRNSQLQSDPVYRECVAAALRALADQVVPIENVIPPYTEPVNAQRAAARRHLNMRITTRQDVRTEILAIAAELRGESTRQED